MEVKGKKEIKSLIRRLMTYNSWRLGEKPFESRGDLYSSNDVDALFDEIIEGLEAYCHLVEQLTEFPPAFKIDSKGGFSPCGNGQSKCSCETSNQKVNVVDKRGDGAFAIASPNKDAFIQS